MKKENRAPQVLVAVLLVAACVLAVLNADRGTKQFEAPRAAYNDATPLGGKGLRLMLQNLGYTVRRSDSQLSGMPADARVWLLLDPETQFTDNEGRLLLKWVRDGGTLIWAAPSPNIMSFENISQHSYRKIFEQELKLDPSQNKPFVNTSGEPFPPLVGFTWGAPGVYRSGVSKASGSGGGFRVKAPHIHLAQTPFSEELALIFHGRGRVIIAPDALLFTNYALAQDDNAVLVSNFVRVHLNAGEGVVYFDERSHTESGKAEVTPNLLYYLWRPPLRWALLQLLTAGLLVWALYGRRLGAPVPLPEREPVTRASQYAVAMGSLFRKANRPKAVAAIIGEDFRRTLVRRLGMSITDSDSSIAKRAAAITGLPEQMIDRLLLKSKNPADDENSALNDAQEMEIVLRRLSP